MGLKGDMYIVLDLCRDSYIYRCFYSSYMGIDRPDRNLSVEISPLGDLGEQKKGGG